MLKLLTKKNSLIFIFFIVVVILILMMYSSYNASTPLIQEGLKPLKLKPIPKNVTNVFKQIGYATLDVASLGVRHWNDGTDSNKSSQPPPRPAPPDQPHLMNGFRYGGCWKGVSGDNLNSYITNDGGAYTMDQCVYLAKNDRHNLAIMDGGLCRTGNAENANLNKVGEKANTDPDCNINATENGASIVYSSYMAPPPETLYDYSYKGCWNATNDPSSNPLPYHIPGNYNLTECVYQGVKLGYKTVGLQNGNQCWAGNKAQYFKDNYKSLGPSTSTDPYACDPANPGPNTAIVYSNINEPVETNIGKYRYGGCWNDKNSSPSLPNKIGDADEVLSLDDCIKSAEFYNYNSVAYKQGGQCYAGNQGSDGINYKKGGEIANNDRTCDVGGPGPDTSIIYTNYGDAHEPTIKGYDYKGCWKEDSKEPAMLYNMGPGYTLDSCIKAAKSGKFDTAALLNQNECSLSLQGVGVSNYKMYGEISDPTSSLCNSNYPAVNAAVVYSTFTSPDPSNPIVDKIKEKDDISIGKDNVPADTVNGWHFKGFWNDSNNRVVNNYLGTYPLNQCIEVAAKSQYNTVSFQDNNQCWASTGDKNYKTYGKPNESTLSNPNIHVGAIYSAMSDPSPHVNCSTKKDGFETIVGGGSSYSVPQPSYNIPQTTTVTFDAIPKTSTIITYSQTPLSTNAASTTTAPSNVQKASDLNQTEKSEIHKKWLPNTPFVYENKDGDSGAGSQPQPLLSKTQQSSSTGSGTDIINNQYGTSTDSMNSGLEFFTNINKKTGKYAREGIESLSPPSKETPGPFVPKTAVVPPVCPSIPPVIIKTDCSVCKTNGNGNGSATGGQSISKNDLKNQMASNFSNTNSNSANGNPYTTPSSFEGSQPAPGAYCTNKIRDYDNIPQPYLPSFSGFGM